MPLYTGTNKIKEVYLGTNKVKEVYLGTSKVYSRTAVDPARWNVIWAGKYVMHTEDGGDGTNLTVNGLTDSKPVKIKADLHMVAWMPGSNDYGDLEIVYDEIIHSLTINTFDLNSNIPDTREVAIPYYYNEEEIGFHFEGSIDIEISRNMVCSNSCIAGFCGGSTCGMAYWVLREVAQYD